MTHNIFTNSTAKIAINSELLNANNIKNGDFVFVRVLGQNKAGKTIVSFLGNRFEVKTQNPLLIGESFKAQVQIENNFIKLVPKIPQKGMQTSFNLQNAATATANTTSNLSAENMLLLNGFAANEANIKILQFAKENLTALNKEKLLKLQKKLLKYGKNAKNLAEIEAFLQDKGINASEKEIEELFLMLDLQNQNERQNGQKQNQNNAQNNFLQKTSNEENIFSQIFCNFSQALNQKSGFLTILNHVSGKNSHWVVLPFSTELNNENWSGSIRFLCDKMQKHAEKFYLSAKNAQKGLIFEFFLPKNMYTANKKFKIFFAQTPEPSLEVQNRLCLLLGDCIKENFGNFALLNSQIVYKQQLCEEIFVDSSICVRGVDQII